MTIFNCSGCSRELPMAPMVGVPITCRCGIVYTATIDTEILYKRIRDLESEVWRRVNEREKKET